MYECMRVFLFDILFFLYMVFGIKKKYKILEFYLILVYLLINFRF